MTFTIQFCGKRISQTEEGIFLNKKLALSAVIRKITPIFYYKNIDKCCKAFQIQLIEVRSEFPDQPITLTFNNAKQDLFWGEISRYGLKSELLRKDFFLVLEAILESNDLKHLNEEDHIISDQCGWIHHDGEWFYLSHEFAIGPNGIIKNYCCSSSNTKILFDQSIDPFEAFNETLRLLEYSFDETAPIWAANLLSLMRPIVADCCSYSLPGIFLSGPTSTGKTELALAFGTLFGFPATNTIENIQLIDSGIREFERKSKAFADTTYILDDARNPSSQSIRQSITTLLDRFGRKAFSGNDCKLIPIITGEPGTFNQQLSSLCNRFVEICFYPGDDHLQKRKKIISFVKNNPYPLRTCVVYFISFLAQGMTSGRIKRMIDSTEKSLKGETRSYDNYFLLLLAFKTFLLFGETKCNLNHEKSQALEQDFVGLLKKTEELAKLNTDEGIVKSFITLLCRAIRSGNLRIYIASPLSYCAYGLSDNPYDPDTYEGEEENTIGHHAVINFDAGFDGVYIKDRNQMMGYSKTAKNPYPTLIIHSAQLFSALQKENSDYLEHFGINILFPKINKLKSILAQKGILYTEDRYEKEKTYQNYSVKYPTLINDEITNQSVLLINPEAPYATELAQCLNDNSDTTLLHSCLYASTETHLTRADIEKCTVIRSFL